MSDLGWTRPLIGVPHVWGGADPATGWDCWGLVTWTLARRFGHAAPEACAPPALVAAARGSHARHDLEAAVAGALPLWRRTEPAPGTVALFELARRPWHVGLVVDHGLMLHVLPGTATCLERMDGPMWAHRLVGCHAPA